MCFIPLPTVLVGAMVDGKPNYITIAHIGIVNHAKPYLISLSMAKVHYTNPGIRENKAFSVNIHPKIWWLKQIMPVWSAAKKRTSPICSRSSMASWKTLR